LSIRLISIVISIFSTAVLAASPEVHDQAGLQFFEARIRPVLVDHCYKCHSAEANKVGKLKGDLFLDSRAGVLKGGEHGPVIEPGQPEKSRLIEAVRYGNKDLQMPPKDQLSANTVADLAKWIAMGAPDPRLDSVPLIKKGIDVEEGRKYWAFQPLARFAPPEVKNAAWPRTPIDRFVLKQQEEKGLAPNPTASRQKLIRRAYFDLLGLPPTPDEVAAFVADSSPDAYEKLIDRLLQSPHYGERWARHWLDIARFAESDGFEQDYDRPAAFQYRDFVIRAFNQDMPFDQFVKWQIAGDELAPDNWQAMAATGFLTAGVFPTQITEREFETTRYNQLDDMVSTVGNSMLGLTIGCARCHDHKFDPIPSKDYYSMMATFATCIRSDIELNCTTPQEREQLKREADERLASARAKLETFEREQLNAKFDAFVASLKKSPSATQGVWTVLDFENVKTRDGTTLVRQPDGSLLRTGKSPRHDIYTLTARVPASNIQAMRLEALTDKSLPHNGPGCGANGNFALTELEITAAPADNSTPPSPVTIASAIATHQQNAGNLSVASSFDGNPATGWAIDGGGIGKNQAAIFRFEKPVGFPGGTVLTITLRFEHSSAQHLIGRPRFSITTQSDVTDFKASEGSDPLIASELSSLSNGETLSPEKLTQIRHWFATGLPEYQQLEKDLSNAGNTALGKHMEKVQVTSEGLPPVKNNADDRGYPHFYKQVYYLKRGDPNNKIEPVTQSFVEVLMRGGKNETAWQSPPPHGARTSYRRTALARWLTDANDGAGNLLARVIVNRLWQHLLGRGIVATPNDFGVQGEPPTNPQLLDWLATDLIDHGWQLKRLQKLIMTSSVYMQNTQTSPDREAIDPHDIYLWRWQPRRLEAEPIRDSLLSVAGVLDPTMFGPGTLDQNMHRRSIYFTVKRSHLIPMMMVLDWPEALNSMATRPTTTIAPQALLFMNSPEARQYAADFSKRITAATVRESIEKGYQIAFGRSPMPSEVDLAATFIAKQTQRYQDAKQPTAPVDAMTDFCQSLMSANEFIYVE
jgi:cytochrome c553